MQNTFLADYLRLLSCNFPGYTEHDALLVLSVLDAKETLTVATILRNRAVAEGFIGEDDYPLHPDLAKAASDAAISLFVSKLRKLKSAVEYRVADVIVNSVATIVDRAARASAS